MYGYLFFIGISLAVAWAVIIFITKYWIKIIGLKSSIDSQPIGIKPHKKTFKILTYNCFLQNFDKLSNFVSDDPDARLEEIINCVIGEYDIVCLQEMFAASSFRMCHLVQRARELGFKWCVVPKAPKLWSRKIVDSGLVILSKHPILEYDCVNFDHPGVFSDQFADKGFQYAKILLYGHTIHVINTHIQSDYEIHDKIAMPVKLLQYKQIKKYIELIQKDSICDIYLCGDLNCNSIFTYRFKPTQYESDLYRYLTLIYEILPEGDLLYDKTSSHDTLKQEYCQRPATTYSTYNLYGQEIDTIMRQDDDPYLLYNNYVCLPRSVDYIILIRNKRAAARFSKCTTCKTKNFEYSSNKKKHKIQYLSDHLGVYANMKFINSKQQKIIY